MPCKDTTARVTIRLDASDRLVDFDFSKLTCRKSIGGNLGFQEHCAGRSLDEIGRMDFLDLVRILEVEGAEDRFLLFLEWDALRTALWQYQGQEAAVDATRYQLDSIVYGPEGVEITQFISPPKEMPKIVSCAVRSKDASGSSA
ncbi:MAG: hypothetical protein ACE5ER_07505 [Nitrospinaceae bacterium]